MWRKIILLLLRRPDLLLAHLDAYRQQAGAEWPPLKKRWLLNFLGLILSCFLLASNSTMLLLAAMLDVAFPLENRLWVYALPAGGTLFALLLLAFFVWRSKQKPISLIQRNLAQDYEALRRYAAQERPAKES